MERFSIFRHGYMFSESFRKYVLLISKRFVVGILLRNLGLIFIDVYFGLLL